MPVEIRKRDEEISRGKKGEGNRNSVLIGAPTAQPTRGEIKMNSGGGGAVRRETWGDVYIPCPG